MKTIVLFSRLELVQLYGKLNNHISNHFKVIHLAYSNKEEKILREKFGVFEVINFKKEIAKILKNQKIDLDLCNDIDQLFIQQSEGRFNLNSAIQYDRTFQFLTYNDCLLLAQSYYKFWNDLFNKYSFQYLLHEPTALFFSHIAANVCKKHEAKYLSQIQVTGEEKFNWIFVEGDKGFPLEIPKNYSTVSDSEQSRKRVDRFLEKFRGDSKALFSDLSKNNKAIYKRSSQDFFLSTIRLVGRHLKENIFSKQNQFGLIDHVKIFSNNYKQSFFDEFKNKWDMHFSLKYDSFDHQIDYYYYPIHAEPEAVVLYWGDGIYTNQVKLIENIAAQLPPNCYLVVKDHPHSSAFREYVYYRRIKSISNVKLIHPGISGKEVIKSSRGVITINGTSGFEALLLNKQVYVFGNTFYDLCRRVVKITNIRDFREKIYTEYTKTYQDDDELYLFVAAYLQSVHKGYTAYFRNYVDLFNIDVEENSKIVAQEMLKGLNNLT